MTRSDSAGRLIASAGDQARVRQFCAQLDRGEAKAMVLAFERRPSRFERQPRA